MSCFAALALGRPAAAQAAKAPRQDRATITVHAPAKSGPYLFGTTPIPIQAQRFASQWARAREDASWHPALQRLVAPARHLHPEAQIAFVQRAVHQRIHWRSDATEWGVHDYWASAVQTLESGYGDMEDRAIVKMQALKLLGFAPNDLYLTLGRDKVGGPMAVLMARTGQRFFVLDDLGGKPLPTERRQGFTPQLSFGNKTIWAHAVRSPIRRSASAAAAAPE